jgi:hypothetical protein
MAEIVLSPNANRPTVRTCEAVFRRIRRNLSASGHTRSEVAPTGRFAPCDRIAHAVDDRAWVFRHTSSESHAARAWHPPIYRKTRLSRYRGVPSALRAGARSTSAGISLESKSVPLGSRQRVMRWVVTSCRCREQLHSPIGCLPLTCPARPQPLWRQMTRRATDTP